MYYFLWRNTEEVPSEVSNSFNRSPACAICIVLSVQCLSFTCRSRWAALGLSQTYWLHWHGRTRHCDRPPHGRSESHTTTQPMTPRWSANPGQENCLGFIEYIQWIIKRQSSCTSWYDLSRSPDLRVHFKFLYMFYNWNMSSESEWESDSFFVKSV